MFNFTFKSFPYLRCVAVSTSPTHKLHFLQHYPLSSSLSALKSVFSTQNQHSFTVDYLIKSCGFPPEKALSASKYTNFETPDKPDSVVTLFRNHGFTDAQISLLIKKLPRLLLSDPENTLLPKIEFFHSKGFSTQEIAKILSAAPGVLRRSLENQIIPAYNFFKGLLKTQKETNVVIKRFAGILLYDDLHINVAPNIEALREIGVPESNIVALFKRQPQAFTPNADRFKEIVEEVKKMGFNPTTMMFGVAIHALRAMSKSTWEKKVEVYKKWGLSEDQILVAFRKNPMFMIASGDKITGIIDFFVNKMGWESSIVARRPVLVNLSLERRIIPRCLVYQILLSKGLIKEDFGLFNVLVSPESYFLKKFVKKYEEEAPELLKLYQGKLNLSK